MAHNNSSTSNPGDRRPQAINVSGQTDTSGLAGSLSTTLREFGSAELLAVGAAAVNQAVKAIAVSRGHLASNGMNLLTFPAFFETTIDGKTMTGIKLIVKAEPLS